MKQTAVEWIEKKLIEGTMRPVEIIAIAKAMEKEQIVEAHWMARCYDTPNSHNEAEQYYTETYESNT